jgi:hypothetical protein
MYDDRVYLKVKIKSLAAEAKIIRSEEKKHTRIDEELGYNSIRHGLRIHRICIVRSEARYALLAYGFIRGRTYSKIEPNGCVYPANWEKIWKMVEKYGAPRYASKAEIEDQKKRFEVWKETVKPRENRKEANSEVCKTSIVGSSPTSPSIWSKVKESLGV